VLTRFENLPSAGKEAEEKYSAMRNSMKSGQEKLVDFERQAVALEQQKAEIKAQIPFSRNATVALKATSEIQDIERQVTALRGEKSEEMRKLHFADQTSWTNVVTALTAHRFLKEFPEVMEAIQITSKETLESLLAISGLPRWKPSHHMQMADVLASQSKSEVLRIVNKMFDDPSSADIQGAKSFVASGGQALVLRVSYNFRLLPRRQRYEARTYDPTFPQAMASTAPWLSPKLIPAIESKPSAIGQKQCHVWAPCSPTIDVKELETLQAVLGNSFKFSTKFEISSYDYDHGNFQESHSLETNGELLRITSSQDWSRFGISRHLAEFLCRLDRQYRVPTSCNRRKTPP
jgi:hypothetical protein